MIPDPEAVGLYLAEVRRFPLLTSRDEVRLGRLVAASREAMDVLVDGETAPTPARQVQLQQAVAAGERAVHHLIECNLRLVVTVARRYRSSPVPLLDLIQEGNLGLMQAARGFDYRLGYRFSTGAVPWITQAITRAIATKSRTIRLPIVVDQHLGLLRQALAGRPAGEPRPQWLRRTAGETGLTEQQVCVAERYSKDVVSLSASPALDDRLEYDDTVEDPRAEAPLRAVEAGFLADSVGQLLGVLEPRERQVVRLRYGIGEQRQTLDEVARRFGLSSEGVRRIEIRALKKLRHPAMRSHLDLDALSA